MRQLEEYLKLFEAHISKKIDAKEPKGLYEPMRYILGLGGKKIRPILTLMSAYAFGAPKEEALDAALAIEIFHNFSLVHDDIMDAAPLRRGQPTVHTQWDANTAILSGDAMLIKAYQCFEQYPPELQVDLIKLFSQTAIQVCEGQQYDMEFEVRNDVTLSQYLKMIEYKTAVLVAAALQMGSMVAKASVSDQEKIYAFGLNLGLAFQLQDDYLDAFGNPETFGKQVGGDIIENKKTYLFLKALEMGNQQERNTLINLFNTKPEDPSDKIGSAKEIFQKTGAVQNSVNAIKHYTQFAYEALEKIDLPNSSKETFKLFAENLMSRRQ